jgi:hypothetical protein
MWEDNIKIDIEVIGWRVWGDYAWRYGQVTGCCEHGNELSDSIK